jgi:23S rRNA (uracil1939-C5)-methyltransferase
MQAGFRLERVVPVDQFKHSPHLEVVGILRKDVAKKRR